MGFLWIFFCDEEDIDKNGQSFSKQTGICRDYRHLLQFRRRGEYGIEAAKE
jgi:hypothetical protein